MSNIEIDDQEFLKELLLEFQEEARQRLIKIENLLISYTPEKKEIGIEIKRELHTLKGSSAMLNLEVFSKVSHKLEDLFKKSEEKGVFNQPLVSFFLEVISLMKEYLNELSQDIEKKLSTFIPKIETYDISNIESSKEDLTVSPETKIIPEEVEIVKDREKKYITIEAEKIDKFLALISEFLFKEEGLIERKNDIKEINILAKRELKDSKFKELQNKIELTYHFFKEYVNNGKIFLKEIKDYMYILRTQPISTIFDGLPAQVFRISHSLGKKIDFKIRGREIQLDRRIISQLNEPLLHLLRNAIDHGIELPEERRKKGKSETGKIVLSARYEGDDVFIELRDDGKGIDPDKIKDNILKKGILKEEELEKLDERGILNLIFMPGFSTKGEVTMLSGRGVGMDIVKNKVLELGGDIYIDSKVDEYTEITLRLPTTLGIGRVLILRISDFIFAILSVHVQSILKKGMGEEFLLGGERFLKIEKKLMPIIEISRIFSVKFLERYYIRLSVNNKDFLLPVEEIIDEKEVTIRPFSEYLRKKVKMFNSFIVLQEGRIAPILNAQVLPNWRIISKVGTVIFSKEDKKSSPYRKILIVEDAPVTRKMEAMILRDEGFYVYEASNGKEALDVFRRDPQISLIITDIEMPVMDGVQLVKKIRKENKKIPIIVVTTLIEREIKGEVFELSNLIIQKKDFTKKEFISKVKRFVEDKG